MRNSNYALAACLLSYIITAVAYLAPQGAYLRPKMQADRADYRSIFTQFLQKDRTDDTETVTALASSLVVVTDPSFCKPCRNLEIELDKLRKAGYNNIMTMTPAEYRQSPSRDRQRVTLLPTLLFMAGDKVKDAFTGYKPADFIRQRLQKPQE